MKNIILLCAVGFALSLGAHSATGNAGKGTYEVPKNECTVELQATAPFSYNCIELQSAELVFAETLTADYLVVTPVNYKSVEKAGEPVIIDPGLCSSLLATVNNKSDALAGRARDNPQRPNKSPLECIYRC